MKLSEIKGARTLDVIAEIADPAFSIAMDDEAAALFKRQKCPEGQDPTKFMMGRLKASLPKLLKSHKADVIAIMAAIEGVTPKEYEEGLTMASLLSGLYNMLTDEDLLAFLS